ncbi:hypothetical protein ACLB2K_042166 [Fragaria x ananassa]
MTTTAQNAAVSHPELSPSISAPPDSVTAFSPLKRKRPPRIEIPNVLQEIKTEKKHDRFFLICKGQERFRVTDLVRTKPYLVAEVQWLEDRPSGDGEKDLDALATEVESYMKDVIRLSNRLGGKLEKEGGDDVEGKIGAVQAVSREAYFTATEASGLGSSNGTRPDISGHKKNRFPDLRGGNSSKSLEAMVKHRGKESLQWGLAAGVYSGLTYGLKEARGAHDWKNSAVAGAITGVALALTSDCSSHEQIVQCAITGAAISSAANLLSGIFRVLKLLRMIKSYHSKKLAASFMIKLVGFFLYN